MKLRSVGLSLPLRRMCFASRMSFVLHGRACHVLYLRLRRMGRCSVFGGSGGSAPREKIFSAPLCLCVGKICNGTGLWLWDAELRSGSGSPNHRSFKLTRSDSISTKNFEEPEKEKVNVRFTSGKSHVRRQASGAAQRTRSRQAWRRPSNGCPRRPHRTTTQGEGRRRR